ncbi:ABC transporter ATP-binding protein [Streptomyces tubbatahanensis]|uniref:ABC transporter ATP-binding protein n=1 Tax=Streptomyces tubbatahanensis TaxID=2923272 RepID=A0ABY3Y3S0_9ACTN|nr:ABC transporter ATP-binding protein [Streptomyces tubbatahanensis]UNT01174.1 ABC transporter ATP-binding protein [Streptomyces tubbatahanensis]
MRGITKRFPGVVANRDIDISVARGTVHALVGENGAGKSTLMKILYGMQRPDEGTIGIDGEDVVLHSPADAIARGIGMVHQHFMLADNLTVLENTVLGAEKLHGIGSGARRKIAELSDAYQLGIRPDALVEELGVADRQRVEILKALYRGARTLILDEPTAVLVPQEVDALFDNLRELKSEGLTVVFISHKLGEVLSVADAITVIRRGTTVASVTPRETSPKQLAELMVGSELPTAETRESTVTDTPMLEVAGLRLAATDSDGVERAVLDGISFTIHKGEVLGVAGVEGNGQAELVEAIMGMSDPDGGTVTLDGRDISHAPTRARRESGIGYIPEDRHRHGLLLEAPLWENRILGHVTEKPNTNGPLLSIPGAPRLLALGDARADSERIVAEYDVRTPGIEVTAASLSGGNQQKFIVGREMSHHPKLLIAAHPTRGVDVGAQAQIWDQIRAARREGLAVLLISADLDELIGLSDTLRVMYRGRLVADADPAHVTPEELGSAMTGAATGHLEHQEEPTGTAAEDASGDLSANASEDASGDVSEDVSGNDDTNGGAQ